MFLNVHAYDSDIQNPLKIKIKNFKREPVRKNFKRGPVKNKNCYLELKIKNLKTLSNDSKK